MISLLPDRNQPPAKKQASRWFVFWDNDVLCEKICITLQREANKLSYHLRDDLRFLSDGLFKEKRALCVIIKALIKQSYMKKKAKTDFPGNAFVIKTTADVSSVWEKNVSIVGQVHLEKQLPGQFWTFFTRHPANVLC